MLHKSEGEKSVVVKAGCLEGLSEELLKGAVHIWTKEAVVAIPREVERWEEEPGE